MDLFSLFFPRQTRYLNTQHSPAAQFRAMPRRVLEPALEPEKHRVKSLSYTWGIQTGHPVIWSFMLRSYPSIGWWMTCSKTSADFRIPFFHAIVAIVDLKESLLQSSMGRFQT